MPIRKVSPERLSLGLYIGEQDTSSAMFGTCCFDLSIRFTETTGIFCVFPVCIGLFLLFTLFPAFVECRFCALSHPCRQSSAWSSCERRTEPVQFRRLYVKMLCKWLRYRLLFCTSDGISESDIFLLS